MTTPWNDFGVAGMVNTAAWLDHTVGMEVLFIGRSATAARGEDCALELSGRELAVRITLRGTWVWLYACGLDEPEPEFIFNAADGPEGWTTIRKFVQTLERSGIKSLKSRPIELGEPGSADSWLIA